MICYEGRLCENTDLKLECAHLRKIWNCSTGHRYAKAGMMLGDFSSGAMTQLELFDNTPPRPAGAQLISVLDKVNNSGLVSCVLPGRARRQSGR